MISFSRSSAVHCRLGFNPRTYISKISFRAFSAAASDDTKQILQAIQDLKSDVDGKFDVVNEKFDVVNEKFDVVNEKFDVVDRHLGFLWESQLRTILMKVKGESFAKPDTYKSVGDFARFFFREIEKSNDDTAELMKISEIVSEKILHYRIPDIYLRLLLQSWSTTSPEAHSIVEKHIGPDYLDSGARLTTVDPVNLGRFIGATKHMMESHLHRKFVSMKEFLSNPNPKSVLHSCRSPGVPFLILGAALNESGMLTEKAGQVIWNFNDNMKNALKFVGVRDGNPVNITTEIEVDCRGSIQLVQDHCTIVQGEIKSSVEMYRKAVSQLRLRCFTWKYFIQSSNQKAMRFVLVGNLIVPRSLTVNVPEDLIQQGVSIKVIRI